MNKKMFLKAIKMAKKIRADEKLNLEEPMLGDDLSQDLPGEPLTDDSMLDEPLKETPIEKPENEPVDKDTVAYNNKTDIVTFNLKNYHLGKFVEKFVVDSALEKLRHDVFVNDKKVKGEMSFNIIEDKLLTNPKFMENAVGSIVDKIKKVFKDENYRMGMDKYSAIVDDYVTSFKDAFNKIDESILHDESLSKKMVTLFLDNVNPKKKKQIV